MPLLRTAKCERGGVTPAAARAAKPTPTPSTHKKLSINTELATSPTTQKPVVSSPDWTIRYDPMLAEYYYVNELTNETQFDHPDEVVSPLGSSPATTATTRSREASLDPEHRKVFKSLGLVRTISPSFLYKRGNSEAKGGTSPQKVAESILDQDVEEFKRQLDKEIVSYEVERLSSGK